jgi:hypothetical protein
MVTPTTTTTSLSSSIGDDPVLAYSHPNRPSKPSTGA